MGNQTHTLFVKKTVVRPDNQKRIQFYELFRGTYLIPAIFGYNFLPIPISRFRFGRVIFVIYALSMSIGFSYIVLSGVEYANRSPYIFVAVEYVTSVSLLLLLNVDTRNQFMKSIELIDEKLHIDGSYYYRLKKITQLIIILAIVTRILYSITSYFAIQLHCNDSPTTIFTSAFILTAVDTNQVPRLIAFFMIKYRMSLLRKRVEILLRNYTVSVIDMKNKRKSIFFHQELYENILESVDIVSKQINPPFLLSLVCSFPKIMLLLYNIIVLHQKGLALCDYRQLRNRVGTLREARNALGRFFVMSIMTKSSKKKWIGPNIFLIFKVMIIHLLMLGIEAVQWAVIPCLPGIVFEMTRAQVDKMKLCLLKYYKNCNDYLIRTEIKEFLNYIELRPCRYTLFRLIHIDVSLPVGLFHLCTTYLIVMIQFSHLFENIG